MVRFHPGQPKRRPMPGLEDWLPDETAPPVFELDRDPNFTLPSGVVVRPERHIADFERRSWGARLFSRPWKPWLKFSECAYGYLLENQNMYVSWKTFNKLKAELEEKK